jgi:hypothetical protein
VAVDFIDIPWGDPQDDNLSEIFNYISTGNFKRTTASERVAENKSLRLSMPSTIVPLRFNGMVDYQSPKRINDAVKKFRMMNR